MNRASETHCRFVLTRYGKDSRKVRKIIKKFRPDFVFPTFGPKEQFKKKRIVIFDVVRISDLPKMEEAIRQAGGATKREPLHSIVNLD